MKKGSLVKVRAPVCFEDVVIPEGTYGMCVDNVAERWMTQHGGKIILFLEEGIRIELIRLDWIEKV